MKVIRNRMRTLGYRALDMGGEGPMGQSPIMYGPSGDLMANGAKELPRELRILAYGETATSKGPYTFTPEGCEKVLAAFHDMGNKLPIDYEHQSLVVPPIKAPAAGYFELAKRDDGLWATNIEWTAEGAADIMPGPKGEPPRYRFFSPAFPEPEGKEDTVDGLWNFALTNLPATKRAPLVAGYRAIPFSAGKVHEGAWDEEGAVQRMRKHASKDGSGDKGQMKWAAYALGFLQVKGEGKHFSDYEGPHHDVKGGELVVSKKGCEAQAAKLKDAKGSEANESRAHLEKHFSQWGGTPDWKTPTPKKESKAMKTVLKKLNLREETEEAVALDAVTRLVDVEREILTLSGRATSSEALGVLAGWKANSEKVAKLTTDLAEATTKLSKIEGEKLEGVVTKLVEDAIIAAKFTPAQKPSMVALGKADLPQLKALIETAVPNAAVSSTTQETTDKGAGAAAALALGVVKLSAEQLQICEQMQIKPEDYVKRLAKAKDVTTTSRV